MSEKKSIKETQEALKALKHLVMVGKKVRDIVSDGVGVDDVPAVFALIKDQADKLDIYNDGFEGADQIKAELQDLDQGEIVAIFMQVIDAIDEVDKV